MTSCSDCPLNMKRIFLGGLIAGVWINLTEYLVHHCLLGERYKGLQSMGYYYKHPRILYPLIPILLAFAVGVLLAWLYASVRDTLGARACTAVKVGLVASFLAAIPANLATIAWSPVGLKVPVLTAAGTFVAWTIGTLLAAWIYKPKEIASAQPTVRP